MWLLRWALWWLWRDAREGTLGRAQEWSGARNDATTNLDNRLRHRAAYTWWPENVREFEGHGSRRGYRSSWYGELYIAGSGGPKR